jgi:ABC-type multidrug transport system ATPase subunit
MQPLAIKTENLNFSFSGKRKVVDDVSLQVPQGSIFGFLGPNGAGKTTTMRLLTGSLISEKDNIYLLGKSLRNHTPRIFENIGTLVETPSLYLHLTGKENLKIITTLRGLPSSGIDEFLKIVGLAESGKRKVKEYSLGMKQRLGIAMALLPQPDLLLLDEPVNGLDPNGMIEMRELLIKLNRDRGITIFISSHLLNEVERTCTDIGIIHKGRLRFQGKMADLEKSAGTAKEVVFKVTDASAVAQQFTNQYPSLKIIQHNQLLFPFENESEVATINRQLVENGVHVKGIHVNEGLEEWFMKIISN